MGDIADPAFSVQQPLTKLEAAVSFFFLPFPQVSYALHSHSIVPGGFDVTS